jgi:diguanylate cyclase (GGDEF)-like protein/PAS domain S-box-containing protein
MTEKRNLNRSEKNRKLQEEFREFTELNKKIRPWYDTFKMIVLYVLIGGIWILFSDSFIRGLVNNPDMLWKIQMYKGWFYVIITALIFFFIIKSKANLFKKAMEKGLSGYQELSATYEEIMATYEELDDKNAELNKQKDALLISKQRYELAVDGANDGIWDWDLKTGFLFFSIKYKKVFGYEADELNDTKEAWESILHPDDWSKANNTIAQYLESKEGAYESTYRLRTKWGEYRWVLSRGKGVWDKEGKAIRIAGSHTDITEHVRLQEKLHTLAYYDHLTGLPNRLTFEQQANHLINEAGTNGVKMVIIYMDIDNFRHINDTLGHAVGDKLLKHIADVLSEHIKGPDIVAHLGGDEFAAVLYNRVDNQEMIGEIHTLLNYIRQPWMIEEQQYFISVSMGAAIYPDHAEDFSRLLQKADAALFHIKENGKDGISIFAPYMFEKSLKFIQMSNQLKMAIQNEEFILYYQPQIDLQTGDIIGAEALIRWNHPVKGFISPMDFIPFAEKTGQIVQLDEWVLRTACKQRKEWEEKGYPPIKLSVNLSSKEVTVTGLAENVKNILEEYQMNSSDIELEVTETAIMVEMDKAIEVIHELRNLGISIALDDFGTGYSSLTYLQKLPIDILKIDREFIKNVINEDEELYIFNSIVDLAHNLGLKVVAEGVETKEQLSLLKKRGCDIGQGYLFSKPIPAAEMENLFHDEKPLDRIKIISYDK